MPKWGPVEQNVMEDCFDTEVLRDQVPRMDDVLDGADMLREAFAETNGFTEDRNMQFVARISTELMVLLEQLHDAGCSCGNPLMGSGGHKEWFLAWANSPWGRAFKTSH